MGSLIKYAQNVRNISTDIEEYVHIVRRNVEGFQNDETAHRIMEDLTAIQKEVRQKQVENNVSAENLERLRSLQKAAQENKTINTYATSQQQAIGHLREINTEINNLLGMDFAMLAKKTSC